MERSEALRRARLPDGDPQRITVTDAAKHLGVSRTRINQLLKKQTAKAARPAAAPAPPPAAPPALRIVMPAAPPPPQAPAAAPLSPEAPPAAPVDLAAVLNPVTPQAAPGAPPPGAENLDADDADAGRELLGWVRRGAVEFTARVLYKANPDDPRLEKLKEENKFLKVALKRNGDKAAPLGWFTRGWVGIVIGYAVEFIKVALAFPSNQKPPAPPPATGQDPEPEAPPRPTTVEENIAQVEGRPRLPIEERLRIYREGKQ